MALLRLASQALGSARTHVRRLDRERSLPPEMRAPECRSAARSLQPSGVRECARRRLPRVRASAGPVTEQTPASDDERASRVGSASRLLCSDPEVPSSFTSAARPSPSSRRWGGSSEKDWSARSRSWSENRSGRPGRPGCGSPSSRRRRSGRRQPGRCSRRRSWRGRGMMA